MPIALPPCICVHPVLFRALIRLELPFPTPVSLFTQVPPPGVHFSSLLTPSVSRELISFLQVLGQGCGFDEVLSIFLCLLISKV